MRAVVLAATLLSLMGTGCTPNCCDTSLYQRTGQVKPIVCVMPVIDRTGVCEAPWEFSREFTDEIRAKVFESSKLYLLREPGSLELARSLNTPNPLGIPSDVKGRLGAAEYVVVSEIIQQEESSYGLGGARPSVEEIGSVLTVAVRVRVIDIRQNKPHVILQEIINHDHIVAKPYLNIDYTKAAWGTEAYQSTPLGMAHCKMVRELVAHVENYILAAR